MTDKELAALQRKYVKLNLLLKRTSNLNEAGLIRAQMRSISVRVVAETRARDTDNARKRLMASRNVPSASVSTKPHKDEKH